MGGVINDLIGGTNTATAALPAIQQQQLLPQLAAASQGVQANINNQNAFAQALQTQMQGGGPNLAGAQLANATGQNVANQAALMASQRGTGSNAGLIARQAAQQGASIQQNAAGQAAAERQAQQLGAQGQLGSVYGTIGQETGQNLSTLENAQQAQNNAIIGGTTATNQINAQVAGQNASSNQAVISGIGQAATGTGSFSKPSSSNAGAEGGIVMEADGGQIGAPMAPSSLAYSGPLSKDHMVISNIFHPHMSSTPTTDSSQADVNSDAGQAAAADENEYSKLAKGGKVEALVSPGERFLKPEAVKKVAEGKADPIKAGEKIPGKPKVPGAVDSYANDTVPKKLEEGGIVIPRHITMGKNPSKDAAAFVQAIVDKQSKKKKGAR